MRGDTQADPMSKVATTEQLLTIVDQLHAEESRLFTRSRWVSTTNQRTALDNSRMAAEQARELIRQVAALPISSPQREAVRERYRTVFMAQLQLTLLHARGPSARLGHLQALCERAEVCWTNINSELDAADEAGQLDDAIRNQLYSGGDCRQNRRHRTVRRTPPRRAAKWQICRRQPR